MSAALTKARLRYERARRKAGEAQRAAHLAQRESNQRLAEYRQASEAEGVCIECGGPYDASRSWAEGRCACGPAIVIAQPGLAAHQG